MKLNDDMERYLREIVGRTDGPETMHVEAGAARRMALAVGDLDPIHFNIDAALSRGYKAIPAPLSYLWYLYFNCSEDEFEFPWGTATVHGQDEYEFHEPILVGDDITVTASVVKAHAKEGKSGTLAFIITERRFVNQHNVLCAIMRTTLIRQ